VDEARDAFATSRGDHGFGAAHVHAVELLRVPPLVDRRRAMEGDAAAFIARTIASTCWISPRAGFAHPFLGRLRACGRDHLVAAGAERLDRVSAHESRSAVTRTRAMGAGSDSGAWPRREENQSEA
jgi:hypothetical protein